MKEERPEIELYMYSLNQEFPVSKGHSTFLKRHFETYIDGTDKLVGIKQIVSQTFKLRDDDEWTHDWCGNWPHDEGWVHDWSGNYGPDWQNWTQVEGLGYREGDPLENIIIRKEDFGGILFDRINDRIYKVNVPGYKLFQEILEAHKKNKLAEFHSKEFESQDIEHFIGFLKGARLWTI